MILFVLFLQLIDLSGFATEVDFSQRLSPVLGASLERMWNWILVDSTRTSAKETPAIGIAECVYDLSVLEKKHPLSNTVLYLNSLNENDFMMKQIRPICRDYQIGHQDTPTTSHCPPSLKIEPFPTKIVSAYGSTSHYVKDAMIANSGEESAKHFMARQLISKCIDELRKLPLASTVSDTLIMRSTSIKELPQMNLSQVTTLLEPSAKGEGIKKAGRVFDIQSSSSKDYSFTQFAIHYSVEQKKALKEGLRGELSCAQGELWLGDGIVSVNKCDSMIFALSEKSEKSRSDLKIALSGAACGIGRRLEGTGSNLYAKLACALTEVINSCPDDKFTKILRNYLALSTSFFVASMIPNGTALGDYSYLPGGHTFDINGKNRPNATGAAIGALYGGALRGIAFAEYEDGKLSTEQVVGNSLGSVATYVGLGSFTSDKFTYGNLDTNEVNELISGAIPGILRSRYRQNSCADRLKKRLANLVNNSGRKALPKTIMQP